jgi:hypothetical protein
LEDFQFAGFDKFTQAVLRGSLRYARLGGERFDGREGGSVVVGEIGDCQKD